jgi:transcriptional regulator with XRE-family HTH domain
MWNAKDVHKEVMELLESVPEVKEFKESFPVRMAHQIIARRIDLHWTQEELAKQVTKITGEPMTQATISRVEGGSPGIKAETYDKILQALGMTGIKIEFGRDPDEEKEMEIKVKSTYKERAGKPSPLGLG